MGLSRMLATAGLAGTLAMGSGCSLLERLATSTSRNVDQRVYSRVHQELGPSYVRDAYFYLADPDSRIFFERAFQHRLETDNEFREGLEKEVKSILDKGAGDALEDELKQFELYKTIRRWLDVSFKRADPIRPDEDKYEIDPGKPTVLEPEKRERVKDLMEFFKKNVTKVRFGVRIKNWDGLWKGGEDVETEFSVQWMKTYKLRWKPNDGELKHSLGITLDRTSIGAYYNHLDDGTSKELGLSLGYLVSKYQTLNLRLGHSFDESRAENYGRHDWEDGNSIWLEWNVKF